MASPSETGSRIAPGTRLNGIYKVERLIAVGGMGEVYAGRAIETGVPVAIKMIRPELAADPAIIGLFRKEALALHQLRHEAIVGYYVFSIDPDLNAAYLAMEFVPGQALSDICRDNPLGLDFVRTLARRMASGLQAAHNLGVIHRDVSPDNIIVPDGDPARAKIIDFGIAKNTLDSATIIGSGFAGKKNCISPEQLGLQGGHITAKTDVYSFGLTLAEALLGRPLDMGGSMAEVVMKRESVPDLTGVDRRIQPLIRQMLDPVPENRPTMAEVAAFDGANPDAVTARDLTIIQEGPPQRTPTSRPATFRGPTPSTPPQARERGGPSPLLMAGAGGAVALLGVLAFLLWPGSNPERPTQPNTANQTPTLSTSQNEQQAEARRQEEERQRQEAAAAEQRRQQEAAAAEQRAAQERAAREEETRRAQLAEQQRAEQQRAEQQRAEAERARQAELAAAERRRQEQERAERARQEEERRRVAEQQEQQRRLAEQEAQRRAEEARRLAEQQEQQRRLAEQEAQRRAAEQEAQRRAAEQQEQQRRLAEQQELQRRLAQEQAAREEAERRRQADALVQEQQRVARERAEQEQREAAARREQELEAERRRQAEVEAARRPPQVASRTTSTATSTSPPMPNTKDCSQCPELVVVPEGTMQMGSNRDRAERPIRSVAVKSFVMSRYPITVAEWQECVRAGGCSYAAKGDDRSPVNNVSFDDAQQYVAWLSKVTGRDYRLPTEAEWEYAAKGGATTRYWWGDEFSAEYASCRKCGEPRTTPLEVGAFKPNKFGLYDMTGNIGQWVSDCWHRDYRGAPKDQSSWELTSGRCRERVVRGGSWSSEPADQTVTARSFYDPTVRHPSYGFRVVRSP